MIAVDFDGFVGWHPSGFPHGFLAGHYFLCIRRRFKKEEVDCFLNEDAFAAKTEGRAAERGDEAEVGESDFFFDFTDRGFDEGLSQVLLPFWKRPAAVSVFHEKHLRLTTGSAIDDAAGRNRNLIALVTAASMLPIPLLWMWRSWSALFR